MGNDFRRGIQIYLETSDYSKGMDSMVASTQKYESQLGELSKKSDELMRSGKAVGKEWDDLQKQMRRTEQQVNKSKVAEESYRAKLEQMKGVLNNLSGASYNQLIAAQRQLTKEVQSASRGSDLYKTKLEQLNRVTKQVSASKREMSGQLTTGGFSIGKLADGFSRFSGLALGAIGAITGITMGLKKFVDANRELESSKANLKALTGLDDESINWLTDQARKLSTETSKSGVIIKQSSQEIVDAYTLVGSAKPELLGNKQALKEVTEQTLTLAAASKMNLNDAVNGVTTSMNMYGASANEASRYVNVLAAGSKFGAASVQQQTDAILKAGVAAASVNVPFEELTGTIQMLGEKGIKSEIAGTGLKKFFLTLATGASDTNPKVVGLSKALETLAEKQLSATQMKKMFREEGYNVAQVLISNTEKVKEYTEAVTGTATALEQAKINSETSEAKMAQAGNKMKELGMQLVDGLNPAILKLANGTNLFLKLLVKMPGFLKENAVLIISMTTAWVAYTIAVNASTIATKIKDFWTNKLIFSLRVLRTTAMSNPFGALLVAATILLPILDKIFRKTEQVNEALQRMTELREQANDLASADQNIEKQIINIGKLSKAETEILQSNIEQQIANYEVLDKEMVKQFSDYLSRDKRFRDLVAKSNQETNAEKRKLRKEAVQLYVRDKRNEHFRELNSNAKSLNLLKEHQKKVAEALKTKKDPTPISDGEDVNEQAYKKAIEKEKRLATEKEIVIKENAIKEKKTLESVQGEIEKVKMASLLKQIEITKTFGQDANELLMKKADTELKIQKQAEDAKLKVLTYSHQASLATDDIYHDEKRRDLLNLFNNGKISEEQYNNSLLDLDRRQAEDRLNIAKVFRDQLKIAEGISEEKRMELIKKTNEAIVKGELSLAEKLKAIRNKNIQDAKERKEAHDELIDRYNTNELQAISLNYNKQKVELDNALAKQQISEEEHAQAVKKIKIEAAAGYASQAVELANGVANMVKAIHQSEADSLEAEKQRELEAAGDNAEERERIENEYAQKALDLKKKQADADAGIQIAQAIAGAALAIIQCFAQLGPFGAIPAAIIAATTAFQISSIISQRNAIKATTLNSTPRASSSPIPPPITGERVVSQAADGRYDVIGEEDGQLYKGVSFSGGTRTGIVKRPTLVAERGDELIVDHATLNRIRMNAPEVLSIIQNNRVPQRADGNYSAVSSSESGVSNQSSTNSRMTEELERLRKAVILLTRMLEWLQRNRVEAFVSLSEFDKKRNQYLDNQKRGGLG